MGICTKITFVLISVLVAYGIQTYRQLSKPLPVPEFDLQKYWGPGKAVADDTKIYPFTIEFSDADVKALGLKLADTSKLVPPLEGVEFQYGFNTNKLKSVIDYWRDTYLDLKTWSTVNLKRLNKFPQFKTKIQGLNIHFIHIKPKVTKQSTKVYPLILLHGWPGSVVEFYDIIPLLTAESADRDFVFEVIAPSLPGYGFSDPAAKKGMSFVETAIIFNNLMQRLGHKKYFVQGGDWGAAIGTSMATIFPDSVQGFHCNMCGIMTTMSLIKGTIASFFPDRFVDPKYHSYYWPAGPRFWDLLQESGYMHIQSTKPDTIGVALSNNPIGLAAYILEKFSTWTNPAYRDLVDGGLEKYFTLDKLLDNLMFYYISNSITSSQRFYKEAFSDPLIFDLDRVPTPVPTACARFRHELMHTIDYVLLDKFPNLIQGNHFEDGGHFAAMQLPKVLYQDIISFVKKVVK